MKAIGKLLGSGEINAALVLALSGSIMVLAAKGDGPMSLKKVVSGALSNPVPRLQPTSVSGTDVSLRATQLRPAA